MGENHKMENRLKIAFLVDQEIDNYAHFLISKILHERSIFQKPLFLRQIEAQKIVHIKKNKIIGANNILVIVSKFINLVILKFL